MGQNEQTNHDHVNKLIFMKGKQNRETKKKNYFKSVQVLNHDFDFDQHSQGVEFFYIKFLKNDE